MDERAKAAAWLGQTEQIASRSLASSSLATSWSYLANLGDRRLASVATAGTLFNQSTSFGYTTNAQDEATGLTQTSDASIATPAASSQSASYNNLNQLTNLGGQAFTFDADGNLTSDGARTYSWDAENRLVAIGYPGQGSKATAFAYDGLGRRIQWSSTPRTGGAVITKYIWCGLSLCQARNSSNAVIRGYYAEGEYTPGGFSHDNYYALDRLGSVRRVFTSLSNSTYDYDAYGQALQTTAATTDFGYAGTVTNADSGLYLATARPYDPVTGRFLTRDPIGEAADPQANLYAYVGDDPVNQTDPEGLAGVGVIGSGSAEVGVGVAGAGATGSIGGGAFWGGRGGVNAGGFRSFGSFARAGNCVSANPQNPGGTGDKFAFGAFAGVGLGLFATNATSVNQLRGPFDTYSVNVGVGPVQASIQVGVSGDTGVISATWGPGFGLNVSGYPTFTVTTGH